MQQFLLNPIGVIHTNRDGAYLQLEEPFIPALGGLEGFRHLNVLWWFDGTDTPALRGILETERPYRLSPPVLGVFATRSPVRPNPIALSVAEIIRIDQKAGRVYLTYTDANDGSPLLDLKPYTPSLDRVERPAVPDWCAHWPGSIEDSGGFDWPGEFNF